jgi:hypothetical protein
VVVVPVVLRAPQFEKPLYSVLFYETRFLRHSKVYRLKERHASGRLHSYRRHTQKELIYEQIV